MSKNAEAVKVVVRCRPLNSKEQQDGRARIVDMDIRQGQVQLRNPKSGDTEPPKMFTFDQVYDWTSSQQEIFDVTARPIIDACMDGYNGTIFAYGQTGTGKSFTMEGKDEPAELRGIIPGSFCYIFDTIGQQSGARQFLVRASYLEIYNEEIRDLLSKNPEQRLELKESPDRGVYVKDLLQFVVKGVGEITSVLQVGKKNRVVGATLMNQDSSRSHSIFTITIETTERLAAAGGAASGGHGASADGSSSSSNHIRVGKLNLVDLAGSERQSKTGATGDRLKEGIKINLSLTALGNVISALVDGKSGHVPYRDSKLTRLLQDSLGGNTKTVMVANIGPADWNYDETLSTLRYANRAKNITNKPRINEDPKDAMLREFQEEIARLKAQLAMKQGGGGAAPGSAAGDGGGGATVVERVVEVEADQQQLMEALRAQMRAELASKVEQDLGAEALAAARQEAEANARRRLEEKMAESNASEEERRKLREALKQQIANMQALAARAEQEKAEQEALQSKISAMESKVLHGGVNLLDKVDELKARSNATKAQLEVQRRQEEEQQRKLEQLQLAQLDLSKKYSSLEEEVAEKTQQLAALFQRYQARRAEGSDLAQQFQAEREDLLADYRALSQQIKLKNLVIACFVPPEYQELIMQHCSWREYDEQWVIDCVELAGNNIRAQQEARQERQGGGASSSSSSSFNLARADAERLQKVYYTYAQLDQEMGYRPSSGAAASSSNPSSPTASSSSYQHRPSSASRRTATAASIAAAAVASSSRPGSSAARRTRELLGNVAAGQGAAAAGVRGGSGGGVLGAAGSPKSTAKAGALKRSGAAEWGSVLLDGSKQQQQQHAAASADQDVIPVARGLVKGSTDAMRRPGSASRQQR